MGWKVFWRAGVADLCEVRYGLGKVAHVPGVTFWGECLGVAYWRL